MKTDIEPDAGAMTSFGNQWLMIVLKRDGLGSVIARLSKENPLDFGGVLILDMHS